MSGHASTVDDPEKHFLGNLLEEDTSHSSPPLNGGSSSSLGTIPPVSVISGVGPISTNSLLRSYWPEPPPPYSPPIQARSALQIDITRKFHADTFRLRSKPLGIAGHQTFIAQPQIHHHHHNLHHHTHTHNVVENHHHYPVTTVTLPSQNYTINSVPGQPPNFSSIVQNNEEGNAQREPAKKCVTTKNDTREQAVQAATIPVTKKPPLSYRDVAARNDQISGSDGSPLTQPELSESTSLPIVTQHASVEAPTKYEVLQKLASKPSKKASNGEDVTSKREREPVRAAMITERSRSSSLFPGIFFLFTVYRDAANVALHFEGNNESAVIDVAARAKRANESVDKKKQTSGTVNNSNQPQVRRRALRKRNEAWWMDKTGVFLLIFVNRS
ncbi:hypothetical protein OESDEN_09528 [Oesophagostomum dentatum]|uniref:Uncharacterized protein n=1 Tax=Oesophagostomum dentatum TaxID=61180 RepID=A0A0B1T086_OESDE|nr:hypothetical protein OESDEN_09528 [Oesophagostomum dentatum]